MGKLGTGSLKHFLFCLPPLPLRIKFSLCTVKGLAGGLSFSDFFSLCLPVLRGAFLSPLQDVES